MAGGMLTKQAVFVPSKLNLVNDAQAGGIPVSLPAGLTGPQVNQTLPGDKIVLDDVSALALSATATGTLYGGIYEYVLTYSGSAAAPAKGTAAFWRAADIPSATSNLYQVSADAQPTAAIPTLFVGVFLNAVTKGNYGWIQIAGIASCLFDSAITAAAVGNPVSVKISAAVASTFDVGVNAVTATIPFSYAGAYVGTAIVLPVISTITAVLMQRPFCRI